MQEGRHHIKPIIKLTLRVFLTTGLAEEALEVLLARGRLYVVRLSRRRSAASGRELSRRPFQASRAGPGRHCTVDGLLSAINQTLSEIYLTGSSWPGAAFGSKPPKAAAGPSRELASVGLRAPRRTHTIGQEQKFITIAATVCFSTKKKLT